MANVVTKYTDYAINTPDFLIAYIDQEIRLRDVPGLTDGVIQGIRISGTHPLVQLTAAFLSSGPDVNLQGILPAITVVENDETEEIVHRRIGRGQRYVVLDQAWVDSCRAVSIEDRMQLALITDKQLNLVQTAITANDSSVGAGDGNVKATITGEFWQRESLMVSLWVNILQDRQIIGDLLRSIVYDLRVELVSKNIKDINIKIANGLVNMNFGQIIHGSEITIDFLNIIKNITITDEKSEDRELTITFNLEANSGC